MISILFAIKAAIATLSKFLLFIGAGAAIGALASVLRPWMGVVGNAIMGAVIVAVLVLSGWATDDSKRLAALKAENKRLEAKALELRLTGEALTETLDQLREIQARDEKTMVSLREKLAKIPDNPACVIDKDIVDELNSIR